MAADENATRPWADHDLDGGLPALTEEDFAKFREGAERTESNRVSYAVKVRGEDAFMYSDDDPGACVRWLDRLRSSGHDVELVRQTVSRLTYTRRTEWEPADA